MPLSRELVCLSPLLLPLCRLLSHWGTQDFLLFICHSVYFHTVLYKTLAMWLLTVVPLLTQWLFGPCSHMRQTQPSGRDRGNFHNTAATGWRQRREGPDANSRCYARRQSQSTRHSLHLKNKTQHRYPSRSLPLMLIFKKQTCLPERYKPEPPVPRVFSLALPHAVSAWTDETNPALPPSCALDKSGQQKSDSRAQHRHSFCTYIYITHS